MSDDKHQRGLYNKFHVVRTDGQSAPGEKHHECRYFVLDTHHDPHAAAALRAYADSCQVECPALARDLLRLADVVPASSTQRDQGTERGAESGQRQDDKGNTVVDYD